MNPETAQVIVAAITAMGVVLSAWLAHGARREARGARTQAKGASRHAEQAAEYGRPTGNGFAGDVRRQLGEIATIATEGRDAALRAEAKADSASESMTRHLEAHANGATVTPMRVVASRD